MVFDINIHLPKSVSNEVGQLSLHEQNVSPLEVEDHFQLYWKQWQPHIQGGNIMLFNDRFINSSVAKDVLERLEQAEGDYSFTQLVDPRRSDAEEVVHRLWQTGFRAIKFHSYVQQLENHHIPQAVKVAVSAAEKGLMICIDTSFGNDLMYRCDNMQLACAIAHEVRETPIFLLHSGGLRMYEAMLLADARPNVYLETSFSIHYYQDSPKWNDFVYVYRKLGADRLVFGSDFPYISHLDAIMVLHRALDQAGFSANEKDKVFHQNGQELFYG